MMMRKRKENYSTVQLLFEIDDVLDIGDVYRCKHQMTVLTILLNFFHLT